jgi:hypothetical protein
VLVTSLPYTAEVVSRMYGGRTDSENRIKQLKEDLTLDTCCLKSFDATDGAFRVGCVLYNLLAHLRETVLRARGLKDGWGRSGIGAFWWGQSDLSGTPS